MNTFIKLITVASLAAASASTALAASSTRADAGTAGARTPSEAQARQQNRMASCSRDAAGKKGDERRAFMKQCLSSSSAAKASADGSGKARRQASR